MGRKQVESYRQPELIESRPLPKAPIYSTTMGSVTIEMADALDRYAYWQKPTVIISDGAYGVGGFPGDPPTSAGLAEWYAPHVAAWSRYSLPETTLWFWNTEIGWATVHPILELHGWEYRGLHVWDKSIAHIAGNVNSKTIRSFPVVTEVCVRYVRNVKLPTEDGQQLSLREWLRSEWLRTGLPLSKTNEACGVKNAATRKYFTQDHLWYFPPPEMMVKLADYANQKPLRLIERTILASSDAGDVVWEPFGGLCSVAIASLRTGRHCYSSEKLADCYELAKIRIKQEEQTLAASHAA